MTPIVTPAELAEHRADAESMMWDVFEIGILGDWAPNPVTGIEERSFTPLFETKGRVKPSRSSSGDQEVGGRTATTVTRELHIPWDSPEAPIDSVARMKTPHSTTDPTLRGDLRIAGPAPGSQTTARRLEVTEVIS